MKDSFIYVGTAAIVAGTIICIACASNMIRSEPKASENVQLAEEPVAEVEQPPAEPATEAAPVSETEPVSAPASVSEAESEAAEVEASTEAASESSEAEDPSDVSDPDMTMSQKQALGKAKNYLEFSAYSYEGLIRQLEFEKYDNADATFAADNCGADWNEQAAKKAKQYLEFQNYSLDELVHQLEFEGFTEEQATYGANEAYKEE